MISRKNYKRKKPNFTHHLNETDYTNILARLYSKLWWRILLGLVAIFLYSNFTLNKKIEDAVNKELNTRRTQVIIDSLFEVQYNKILNLELEYTANYKNAYEDFDSRLENYLKEITSDSSNSVIGINNGFINIEDGLLSINTVNGDSVQKLKIEYNSMTTTLRKVKILFKKKFTTPPKLFISFKGNEFRKIIGHIPPQQNKFLPLITVESVTTDYALVTIIGNSYRDEDRMYINTFPQSFNWLAIGK